MSAMTSVEATAQNAQVSGDAPVEGRRPVAADLDGTAAR